MADRNESSLSVVWCTDDQLGYSQCRDLTGSAMTYCVHSPDVLIERGVKFPGPQNEPGVCLCNIYFWNSGPNTGNCSEHNGGIWRKECVMEPGNCTHWNKTTTLNFVLQSFNLVFASFLLIKNASLIRDLIIMRKSNRSRGDGALKRVNNPLVTTLFLLLLMPIGMLLWAAGGYVLPAATGDLRYQIILMRAVGVPLAFCSFLAGILYLTLAWDTISRASSAMKRNKNKGTVLTKNYMRAVQASALTLTFLILLSLYILRNTLLLSVFAFIGFLGSCFLYHIVGYRFVEQLRNIAKQYGNDSSNSSGGEYNRESTVVRTVKVYKQLTRLIVRFEISAAGYLTTQLAFTLMETVWWWDSEGTLAYLNTVVKFFLVFFSLIVDYVLLDYLAESTMTLRGKRRTSKQIAADTASVASTVADSNVVSQPTAVSQTAMSPKTAGESSLASSRRTSNMSQGTSQASSFESKNSPGNNNVRSSFASDSVVDT